jgi:hypothetical protein
LSFSWAAENPKSGDATVWLPAAHALWDPSINRLFEMQIFLLTNNCEKNNYFNHKSEHCIFEI